MKTHSVFSGRRVLVTGHTGFKGSWLSLWLHDLGAEVLGFALPPTHSQDHFIGLGLDRMIRHHVGDIRNFKDIAATVHEFRPEFVFHLAAQSLVRPSYTDPKGTFDTNVGGSVNVLEALRDLPSLRVLIYATSDKCYRNNGGVSGYRESDELGGRDPYSASKAAAEHVFAAYVESFLSARSDCGAASVRAGNVIGGGDWSDDRIVPDAIRALERGEPVILRNPASTRPWQHVLDPLSGYLLLAARLFESPQKYSGAWNFGPDTSAAHSVQELASAVVRSWGDGSICHAPQSGAPHEEHFLHLNCDKAHCILGWRPRWDFEQAVHETVYWYRSQHEGADVLDLSRRQIQSYLEHNK